MAEHIRSVKVRIEVDTNKQTYTLDVNADCECGRRPVAVEVRMRNTSLLVRRIVDMGHKSAADWRCVDCVADMADEVARNLRKPWHPDFPEEWRP